MSNSSSVEFPPELPGIRGNLLQRCYSICVLASVTIVHLFADDARERNAGVRSPAIAALSGHGMDVDLPDESSQDYADEFGDGRHAEGSTGNRSPHRMPRSRSQSRDADMD